MKFEWHTICKTAEADHNAVCVVEKTQAAEVPNGVLVRVLHGTGQVMTYLPYTRIKWEDGSPVGLWNPRRDAGASGVRQDGAQGPSGDLPA